MIAWTHCDIPEKGNLISWPVDLSPELNNKVKIKKSHRSIFCRQNHAFLLVLPGKLTFNESLLVCEQLRSNIFTYTDKVSHFFPDDKSVNFNENYWTGHVSLDGKSKEFVDYYDVSKNISSTNLYWNIGEPNGNLYPSGFWTECCAEIVGNNLF